ncbi:Cilia- and flagella-associated protein 44 [Eumeta japonica]|uniref:Cilia-and flagella-associated protein 44 n=1 Tax=Eumeta variegata TaxID=151549 RepID=A0A4C1XPS0_EUMVA|nr:Cilia- and flagella-associated protein 44 [Eumeta japonica]
MSYIYGAPELLPSTVLSGCEWGNILVWEAGLVKVEVTQRGRKPCHDGPVVQLMLSEVGWEVTTVAQDGCIRTWYWDSVEQADPPEDDQFVEVNPVAETCVRTSYQWLINTNVYKSIQTTLHDHVRGVVKRIPGNVNVASSTHHAVRIAPRLPRRIRIVANHDGNGGVWTVDMELDKLECQHTRRTTSHAGRVVGLAPIRGTELLATAGADGSLLVFNTETKVLLARYQLAVPITYMLYPPPDVEPSSRMLILGFADGTMRILLLHAERLAQQKTMYDFHVESLLSVHSSEHDTSLIDLVSFLKPHTQAITQIVINEPRTLLVTAGRDHTLFMYRLELSRPFALHRLGYIETPNKITYITWKPATEFTLLLCGKEGLLVEAELPDQPMRDYDDITSFKLEFKSCIETVVKKYILRNRPLPEEEDLASLDEEALKAAEEAEEAESVEEEGEWLGEIELVELEKDKPSTLTWAQYCDEGIWVVQRDTGSLLLVRPGGTKVLKYAPLPDAWQDSVVTLKFICQKRYLMMGTVNGYLRVVRMPSAEEDSPEHHRDVWLDAQERLLKKLKGRRLLEPDKQPTPRIDFEDLYYLPMHDRYTGEVTALEFSSDESIEYTVKNEPSTRIQIIGRPRRPFTPDQRLYSAGADGNIFSYAVRFPERLFPETAEPAPTAAPVSLTRPGGVELRPSRRHKVHPLQEPIILEEMMSHEQLKKKEEHEKMMTTAAAHKKLVREELAELTIKYVKLVKANRQMPVSQQIDLILDPRPLMEQEKELAAGGRPHSADPEVTIRPLRQKNLSKVFQDQLNEVHQKMAEAALKGRRAEGATRRAGRRKTTWGVPRVASFLLGLPPHPPHPLKKAIRNYRQRLNRHQKQFVEWQEHLVRKADPKKFPPGAEGALRDAEATIGNHVLKTQPEYVAASAHDTQLRICLARQEIYDIKHEFNMKVTQLRKRKVELVELMRRAAERLAEIRVEVPARRAKQLPELPHIDEQLEFPEKNLEVRPEVVVARGAAVTGPAVKTQDRRKSAYPQARVRQPRVPRFVPLIGYSFPTDSRPLAATWELLKIRQDYEASPVEEKNALLELHLIQLHREMDILNRFEAQEDRLAERVYGKLSQNPIVNRAEGVSNGVHVPEDTEWVGLQQGRPRW